MKILLDTSILIDFLRLKDKEKTLLYKISEEELYISIITHTELFAGKSVWEKKEARRELEELFSGMEILPLTLEISESAGKIKSKNKNLSLLDCIIGATAICSKMELVTLNIKDFSDISGINFFKETN